MKKRILSLFLAVVMLVLAVPAMAFAVLAAEAAAQPTVSTTFSADSGLYPAIKLEDGSWNMAYNLDFKGGWSFGSLALNVANPATLAALKEGGFSTTLNAYTARNNRTEDVGDFLGVDLISSADKGWSGNTTIDVSGAIGYLPDGRIMLCSGTRMSTTTNKPDRQVAQAAVRYTAQYTGDVTVTVNGDWFDFARSTDSTVGYAHIFVLKNGTLIQDIVRGADKTINVSISTTLAKNDTLDFVAVLDPEYDATHESSVSTIWRREAANRFFIVNAFTVEYSNVVSSVTASSTFDSHTESPDVKTTVKYAYDSEEVRFFQWYDENNNPLSSGASLTTGCYAKLNPEMAAAAGIDLENDTYAQAFDRFVQLLAKAQTLNISNKDWTVGYYQNAGGKFEEIKYPVIYFQRNLGLVNASGVIENPARTDAWEYAAANAGVYTTKTVFDMVVNELKADFAAYVSDDTTLAGNVKIDYNSSMTGVQTSGWNVSGYPYGRTAVLSIARPYQTHFRSGYSYGYAAYRYTAPRAGALTFSVDDLTTYSGTNVSWNVAVNGSLKFAHDANYSNIFALSNITNYKNAIAELDYEVEAGTTVDILLTEGNSSGVNGLKPVVTANLIYNPMNWTVEGQLAIDSNYSVSALAAPADANGTMSAIVDGQKIEGVKQANGSYKMLLKGGIYITDLTSTKVTYTLQEESNGHVIKGVPREMDVDTLLSKYEAHEVPEIARLAKDIRLLADYTNFQLGKIGEPSATARTDMKRNDTAIAALSKEYTFGGTVGDFKIISANVNFDDSLRLLLLVDAASAGASKWDLLDKESYEMKVYDGATALDFEISEFGTQEMGGVTYMGVLVEIPVSYWNRQLTFQVEKDGVAVSRSLNYSHNTWCAFVYRKGYSSAQYMARGVYNVGRSAAAYLEYVAANA